MKSNRSYLVWELFENYSAAAETSCTDFARCPVNDFRSVVRR